MDSTINLSNYNKPEPDNKPHVSKDKNSFVSFTTIVIFLTIILGGLLFSYFYFVLAPSNYEPGVIIKIVGGEKVKDIGIKLKEAKIITSPFAFRLAVKISGADKNLQQGEYLFDKEENVYLVAKRIGTGDYGIDEERVLIREGLTRKEISEILTEHFPAFSAEEFMEITKNDEGYLFPDTYVFFKTASSSNIVSDMRANFSSKTSLLKEESDLKSKSWQEVVNIASLLELEGKTKEDKSMIADIIYRRMKTNMPLQLDAPFLYYMNKASLQLTKEDLFSDSPYNTYRNKGLPPTPICNPGLISIEAAINPTPNEYLYYLSDKNGIIHYAKTFEDHKKNKKEYL